MSSIKNFAFNSGWKILVCLAIFFAGIAVGSLHTPKVSAQGAAASAPAKTKSGAVNRFGQPKTVLHVVAYKFKDTTSEYDREKALDGIKDLARKIPGVKNVWLKTARNQMQGGQGNDRIAQ